MATATKTAKTNKAAKMTRAVKKAKTVLLIKDDSSAQRVNQGKGRGNRTKYEIPVPVKIEGKTLTVNARTIRVMEDGTRLCHASVNGRYRSLRKEKSQRIYRIV